MSTEFTIPAAFEKCGMSSNKDRAQHDFELWDSWKRNGEKPEDLRPLLKSFRGMLRSNANKWSSDVDFPPEAIHAEFNKGFLRAVETYDPNKGAALGTWVEHNLRKAKRWVATYRNPSRIQEGRFYKVGEFETAQSVLDGQLGREPTTQEMSDYLGWAQKDVTKMQTEKRRMLTTSGWESDPTSMTPSRESEILSMLPYDLSGDEKLVYEYLVGYGGKPQLKPIEIARKMGWSASKVTRLKQAVARKAEGYMGSF